MSDQKKASRKLRDGEIEAAALARIRRAIHSPFEQCSISGAELQAADLLRRGYPIPRALRMQINREAGAQ